MGVDVNGGDGREESLDSGGDPGITEEVAAARGGNGDGGFEQFRGHALRSQLPDSHTAITLLQDLARGPCAPGTKTRAQEDVTGSDVRP